MTCEHCHLPPCPYCEILRLRTALRKVLEGGGAPALVKVLTARLERAELTVVALRAELANLSKRRPRQPAPVDTLDV